MNFIFQSRKELSLGFILLLFGCNSTSETNVSNCTQDHSIQATYWYQKAAENAALYHQAFNIAKDRIDIIMAHKHEKAPAIVLDIDETVLDNSFFQVESIRKGLPYSLDRWNNWVKKEVATPVPGAVDFIKYALEKGINVIFITNREESVREYTLRNMAANGFPQLPNENYLFKTSDSDKTDRRAIIADKFEIHLLLGDNLSDFSGIFENRSKNYGLETVEENKDLFGRKFIAFPNPTYGDWQKKLLINNDSCINLKMINRLKE